MVMFVALGLLSATAFGSPATSSKASAVAGRTLAICRSAVHQQLVQVRGDGNQVAIVVSKTAGVTGSMFGTRVVKGNLQNLNLEVQYTAANGFVNLSCNSEPVGLIRINGITDYLTCQAGPDAQAVQLCNRRWNSRR